MSSRDRILIMVLAVVAIVGGAWFGLVGPKRAESRDLAAQIETAKASLTQATQQTAAAEAAQESFGEDAAAVATLGKAVPDDVQTASLLYQLDAAAGKSQVELRSITPTTVASGPAAAAPTGLPAGVSEVVLSLTFSGRFADLQRFLRRAHGNTSVQGDDVRVRGRLLTIRGVTLTPTEGGRVDATVSAVAYMTVPVAAAPAAPADGAAPAPESSAATAPPTQPAMIGAGG